MSPALRREALQGKAAVRAVVADAFLVPGPVIASLRDAELIRSQHSRSGAFVRITTQGAATGTAGVEANLVAVVMLLELHGAVPRRPHQVSPHRPEDEVQVAEDSVLVLVLPHVEGHVTLLDVRLQDVAVALFQARLSEAPRDEGQDARHEVRVPVMQATPVFPQGLQLRLRFGNGQIVGPDAVGQAPREGRQVVPPRRRVQRSTVGVGQQLGQPCELGRALLLGYARAGQPFEESGRPHLVDEVDDLRLLHEVVDELRRSLPATRPCAEDVPRSPPHSGNLLTTINTGNVVRALGGDCSRARRAVPSAR
ncbi:MAG: hypothetical protein H0V12_00695, partial [Chloroflexi bacterium]|nr:hypothetical protein [Chloroflexota bacterium]